MTMPFSTATPICAASMLGSKSNSSMTSWRISLSPIGRLLDEARDHALPEPTLGPAGGRTLIQRKGAPASIRSRIAQAWPQSGTVQPAAKVETDLTGWLRTGLIERISLDRRSWG
ncbi:hypothetical protein ACU4GR_10060 (plasmid) [Methylobacterium oryzae CBMB20]